MANKQVLLVKPVKGLGHEGEAVKVKAGYARNFLFPQNMALPVNRSNKRQLDVLAKRREERLAREMKEAKELAEKLSTLVLNLSVKTGEDGKPHGSVTNMEIHKALKAAGFEVERHHIKTGETIKTLGEHTVTVKIHADISAELKINVVSENPVAEKKAEKEESKKKARKSKEDSE
jgi:large subunit ribosomal protein L9